jgi:hypothetical protein
MHDELAQIWIQLFPCGRIFVLGIATQKASTRSPISYAGSFCETLFSIVKKMTTDMRSQFGRGKEGHASDSVYKDVHGVKNTLCGLLTSKINV